MPASHDAPRPRPWTRERVARLGFLVGLGFSAKRIAADPLIKSTAGNVYRQAHRFGISISETPPGAVTLRLPLATTAAYDSVAARVGLTREALIRRTIIAAGANVRSLEEAQS